MTQEDTEVVTRVQSGDVAVLRFDDGKANALSFAAVRQLAQGLDAAAETSRSVILVGRPGRFCAGLDLTVVKSDNGEAKTRLLREVRELYRQMLGCPIPIISACTGHALAGGALLLLASDYRLAVNGEYLIGLTEISIGMPLPDFGLELAAARLSRPALTSATLLSKTFGPREAAAIGFVDVVCAGDIEAEALTKAAEFANLDPVAFATTKRTASSMLFQSKEPNN